MKRLFSRRPTRRQVLWAIGIGCLLVALATFVYLGYHLRWRWTGFPQKRLFDWIQILVIPVAVAIGTFALNRAAKRRDDAAQARQAEEASLQAYLDYMARMVIDPDRPLRRSKKGDDLSVIARAQTLTVLGRLEDGDRKRRVIQFLSEVGLISGKSPVIDLRGANLQGANLFGAALKEANLPEVNLQRANLMYANLSKARLTGATLLGANLKKANLQGANLKGAHLLGTGLRKDKLSEGLGPNWREKVFLQDAKGLTQDQIEQAVVDRDTTVPKGIEHPLITLARGGHGPTSTRKRDN